MFCKIYNEYLRVYCNQCCDTRILLSLIMLCFQVSERSTAHANAFAVLCYLHRSPARALLRLPCPGCCTAGASRTYRMDAIEESIRARRRDSIRIN